MTGMEIFVSKLQKINMMNGNYLTKILTLSLDVTSGMHRNTYPLIEQSVSFIMFYHKNEQVTIKPTYTSAFESFNIHTHVRWNFNRAPKWL